jgi:hypothetical protein
MGTYYLSGNDFAQTACEDCGASGPEVEQTTGLPGPELLQRADEEWNRRAEAAIEAAVLARVAPTGWKLVPVEPTQAMFDAFYDSPLLDDSEG